MSAIQSHKAFWGPITELIERARLVSKGMGLSSEKTTDRLVRYYATQGVLDKPDRLGRDAAYNYRHLLQLLTARRLSEKGVSLEVIGRHNLATTTEQLEASLLKPVQMEAYAPIPKQEGWQAALNKSPIGSPVAMVDLLAEVKALRDLLAKDREELRVMRDDLRDLALNLKDLGDRLGHVNADLDAVTHIVKSGVHEMRQSEQHFFYTLEKHLSSYGEHSNYLAEGLKRVEGALFKMEIAAGHDREK
jgi:DNA-binding transcriptional MerR regulator